MLPVTALARPEYAAREKASCVQCHVTPWGGGPRNTIGKQYGTHRQGQAETIDSDLYYGDLRFLTYYPTTRVNKRTHGLATMEAAVTANVPVLRPKEGTELRGVLTYDFSPLSSGVLREAYARFDTTSQDPAHRSIFLLGRFYAPFGLLTDEHRTYTRIQTQSQINTYHVGASFSKELGNELHFDWIVVNDFQSGGTFLTDATTLGSVFNFRWNPQALPFLLGISGNYEYLNTQPDPRAISGYAILSLDRLTKDGLSGSISWETVFAQQWNNPVVNNGNINPNLVSYFIPAGSTYQNEIVSGPSLGNYLLAKYNLDNKWTLVYKFDYLALDTAHLGQNYTRHGFGFETFLNPSMILTVRGEFQTTPTVIGESDTLAAQSDVFLHLRLWL